MARVSVLMPVWKPNPRFLREAIDSVRAQTMTDWELIIVEDPPGSGVDVLVRELHDSRIRHQLRTSRGTLADALNDGLATCASPLVARLDSDDRCRPDRLERQAAHFGSRPDVAALGTSLTVIDSDGRVLGHRRYPTADVAGAMRRFNSIAHPAVMFRRDVVRQLGGYSSQAVPEDYDLWCRMVRGNHRLENLPDELLEYRFHEGALKFEAVRDVIRSTINMKLRYFRNQMGWRDRLRILGERALLLLPPSIVLRLFRWIEYRA